MNGAAEETGPPPRSVRFAPERPPKRNRDDDIGEDDEASDDIPSERKLLQAKRARRSHDTDHDGDTHIDQDTSLASEGIAVEPFHMRNEESDGTGYFDGDTYVFRNQEAEESDPWLDSLNEEDEDRIQRTVVPKPSSTDGALDILPDEDLYAQIVPLVSDTETVLQAIGRYGALMKRKDDSFEVSRNSLNTLTASSNALMMRGRVDIYQKTRNDLLSLLPPEEKPEVQWEYRGSEDGQIHGPFSTAQMVSWTQQGYFVGQSAVLVRPIATRPSSSTDKDDLLNDLLDDDDATGNDVPPEWLKSDEVDFSAYR